MLDRKLFYWTGVCFTICNFTVTLQSIKSVDLSQSLLLEVQERWFLVRCRKMFKDRANQHITFHINEGHSVVGHHLPGIQGCNRDFALINWRPLEVHSIAPFVLLRNVTIDWVPEDPILPLFPSTSGMSPQSQCTHFLLNGYGCSATGVICRVLLHPMIYLWLYIAGHPIIYMWLYVADYCECECKSSCSSAFSLSPLLSLLCTCDLWLQNSVWF